MTEVLQPGVQIRPIITVDEARALAERLYGFKIMSIKEMEAYDDKNYHIKVEEKTITNKNLSPMWPHGFVFKILNSMDSKKVSFVEAQNEMMLYLGSKNIRCTEPEKNLQGNHYSIESIPAASSSRHIVRLLKFQPGDILYCVDATPELCLETGHFLARMNTALEGFSHPAYKNHSTIWALSEAPQLSNFLYAVREPQHVQLVTDILDGFQKQVITIMDQLPKGMIHGDFNEHNVLVQKGKDGAWHVDGVLDFGDTQMAPYLFEVALAACYMALQAKPPIIEPFRALAVTVAGYHVLRPLSQAELKLMQVCVCARLCQSFVLGAYSYEQDPTNEYVLQTSKSGTGWKILAELWSKSSDSFLSCLQHEIQQAANP